MAPASASPRARADFAELWLEQADGYHPAVAIDALDRVSVQLKLATDGGRKVNPASVQLSESDPFPRSFSQVCTSRTLTRPRPTG